MSAGVLATRKHGATWACRWRSQIGRLCPQMLHFPLLSLNLEKCKQTYLNMWNWIRKTFLLASTFCDSELLTKPNSREIKAVFAGRLESTHLFTLISQWPPDLVFHCSSFTWGTGDAFAFPDAVSQIGWHNDWSYNSLIPFGVLADGPRFTFPNSNQVVCSLWFRLGCCAVGYFSFQWI